MELADAVRRRRMIRSYDPSRPVPAELVELLLAAAVRAPSAGFTQGTSFLVLSTDDQRATFWSITAPTESSWSRGMQTAPVLVLVWADQRAYLDRYAEPDKGWTDRDLGHWSAPYWWVDAGMAAMAALLTAVDHQLGACFFGVPAARIDPVRAAFGVPDGQASVGVISLGYAASNEQSSGSPTRRPRRPRGELVHHGRW